MSFFDLLQELRKGEPDIAKAAKALQKDDSSSNQYCLHGKSAGTPERRKVDIMTVFGKQMIVLSALAAALFLIPAPAAIGTEAPSKAAAQEAAKKKKSREKAFLLRIVEDLDRSQAFVQEIVPLLKKQQSTAAVTHDEERRRKDLHDLLDWYQEYSVWLTGMTTETENDLSEHFSRKHPGTGWVNRYKELAKGYHRLSGQLAGQVRKMENEQARVEARIKKLSQAVLERRILVDKEELELSKELRLTTRHNYDNAREAVYRDLTDEEVGLFRRELIELQEEKMHFEVVTKLGQCELGWLALKTVDSEALQDLAIAIEDSALDPLETAFRRVIRIYEADVATLKRRVGEVKGSIAGIARTGSLKTLDRLRDLTDYQEKMKFRFERHIDWLQGQIGSFQADLVELERER